MSRPVVHFEIVGARPAQLRQYYGDLFGWQYDVGDASTDEVSQPGEYGFVGDEDGINGGVCGGAGFTPRVLFYVGVPDVEAALGMAESLGGTRVMGPARQGAFAVGHLTDPEGNLIGVAGMEES
jgi:predicted enzyme related to lactoylglutathione lyase